MLGSYVSHRKNKQCYWCYVTERKKKMPFMGPEPRIFCYPGRCLNQAEQKDNLIFRLASECIITDANTAPEEPLTKAFKNPRKLSKIKFVRQSKRPNFLH